MGLGALAATSSLAETDEVLARTEYRGPPWNLSILDQFELVYEDGVPMDTYRHRVQMELLLDVVEQAMRAQQRTDYYASGDMFVYYTPEQAHFVADHKPPAYRSFVGPDFFFVDRVSPKVRDVWTVWEEDDRYPDVIAELLSPSTAHIDRGVKKSRYAKIFGTAEYYLYKPGSSRFTAFRLDRDKYREAEPDEFGRVYSAKLQAWLGLWQGTFRNAFATWLRLYDSQGKPIPTTEEVCEAERQRADAAEQERDFAEQQRVAAEQRADQAERQRDLAAAEILRLRALLGQTDR